MPRGQEVLWLRWGLRTRRLRVRASRSTALRLGVISFSGIKPSIFPLYHMIQAPIDINTSTAPEYTNRSLKSRPPISRGTKTPIKRVDTPRRSMRTANTSTNLQWVSPTRSAPDIIMCLWHDEYSRNGKKKDGKRVTPKKKNHCSSRNKFDFCQGCNQYIPICTLYLKEINLFYINRLS